MDRWNSVLRARWLDAQHQYKVIAQRADERPVPHVVVDIATTAATATGRTRPRLTHPRPTTRRGGSGGGRSSGGGSRGSARPRWSGASSTVMYTPAEVQALTPVRESIEKRAPVPDLRDAFLCHAWDDRAGAAKELHDLLESLGVSVWFSEKDRRFSVSLLVLTFR